MKKSLMIALIAVLIILFTACNVSCGENTNDVSKPEVSVQEQESATSEDEETSYLEQSDDTSDELAPEDKVPEDDQNKLEFEWYDQEQLDKWIEKSIAHFKEEPCSDDKHFYHYFSMPATFISEYVTEEANEKYKTMFSCTEDKTIGHRCDYFGITKEEYQALVEKNYDSIMMLGEYNIVETVEGFHKKDLLDWGPPYAREYMFYNYDAWFSDEFWNHPDLMYNGYVAPEIDDHYTSLKDRNGYTKRFYIIDSLLIEHVGPDAFEQWLENKEDADKNIIEFVKDFGITREVYEDIYRETCWHEATATKDAYWSMLPYNPYYLFGTEEMQDEYFKVHPLK